jgi:hypothetical protein
VALSFPVLLSSSVDSFNIEMLEFLCLFMLCNSDSTFFGCGYLGVHIKCLIILIVYYNLTMNSLSSIVYKNYTHFHLFILLVLQFISTHIVYF